jgi:hypothetical protein
MTISLKIDKPHGSGGLVGLNSIHTQERQMRKSYS